MAAQNFSNKNDEKLNESDDICSVSFLINKLKKYISNIEELLKPAAENIKIENLESISGKKFPEIFKNLYLEHDGEGDKVFGVMAGFKWMNIDSIISAWTSLQESAYSIISDKDGVIQDGSFRKGWIPFAEDSGGSFLVMDLDPGIIGKCGQVITIDRDSNISYVISESFQGFFDFLETSFKNGALSAWDDDDVKVIEWKNGHLFDDILALTGVIPEEGNIPVSGFWEEYFKADVINGSVSTEILAKQKMVFIKANMGKEFGMISLDILKSMINLKELIIHAEEISSFECIKDIPNLKKFVVGSKSFKTSDLEYVIKMVNLKELTLVNLSLENIGILENIKTLRNLNLSKISSSHISSLKALKGITELSLRDIEAGDLSYLSELNKLTKLELKKVNIPNLSFLKGLKKLTVFDTDRKAEDESDIELFQDIINLKDLTYPIGDMKVIKNSVNLKTIGVDATRVKNVDCISDLNINSIHIFNAVSKENATSIVAEFKKYFKLQASGWEKTWDN